MHKKSMITKNFGPTFLRLGYNLFTSLYKNIKNNLAILIVLVAQWIERPIGKTIIKDL